ncbi:CAP domain-containing protein [Sulfitobacter sp. D35]|uniref:CAP domain-containing protein n=1 Tax=Sulfitobacter sp. D35 TaxID=3083252 RepID=UPI00296F8117|nr:CAP domain-containing protein [Sulfitobacter sp. D35]MDW4499080.1 CAP domain-containing protein [Sulfitobacter sp. D35]
MKNANALEIYVLELVNAARQKAGVGKLTLERNLNESAEKYSKSMLKHGFFSHDGADGSNAHQRIAREGYDLKSGWSTGENIAAGTIGGSSGLRDDVKRLFDGLMESPGHKANILSAKYEHAGFGIEIGKFDPLSGKTSMVLTQHFGKSSGAMDEQMVGSGRRDRLDGDAGNDLLDGNGGGDILRGGQGSDKIRGDGGRDKMFGGSGNDHIKGGSGSDMLRGDAGRDVLRGDGGRDNLNGGTGNDRMTGGSGPDTFVFRNGDDHDRITDFSRQDTVRLDDALWSGNLSANQVVNRYGEKNKGSITLDFGDDSLTFDGFSNYSALADSIDIF